MGSDSDLPVMAKAAEVLEAFGVEFQMAILSAHRTPVETMEFAARAEEEGYGVLIAGAGMAAHLPGVLAARTSIPVIGVPIASGPLQGEDALFPWCRCLPESLWLPSGSTGQKRRLAGSGDPFPFRSRPQGETGGLSPIPAGGVPQEGGNPGPKRLQGITGE